MNNDMAPGGLTFSLGGVRLSFQAAGSGIRLVGAPGYRDFITSGSPDLTLQVVAGPFPGQNLGAARFEASNWSLFSTSQGDVYRLRIAFPGPFVSVYTTLLFPDGRNGQIYIEDELGGQPPRTDIVCPPPALDELLAVNLMARQRGLLVHACGLCLEDGTGLLFSGYSGSGKSTTARIWQQAGAARLLSDERVAVFRRSGQFWMGGTPWHGDGLVSTPLEAPLQRLFILRHAPANHARPLKPTQAVTALLERAFLPFWDALGMAFTLEFLQDLCTQTPCYELGFLPDESIIEFVRCLS